MIGVAVLGVALSTGAGVATATTRAPAAAKLKIAWRAGSATTFNAPALAPPRGVVTTADNVATMRWLLHGGVRWKQVIPDQQGLHITLGAPVTFNGAVDAVTSMVFGAGTADFAVKTGAPTLSGPTFHELVGQLAVNGTSAVRVTGGYGSGYGPFYELDFAGNRWYVLYGAGSVGIPAIQGSRVFVPVDGEINGYDPTRGCPPLPIPDPPPICAPTWQAAFAGTPSTPVGAGPDRIAVSDTSGVVTALRAQTGATVWATPSFSTPLGAPASANGLVYVGGADGVVRAINVDTGKVKWQGQAGAPIITAPTAVAGRVFVATDDGRLVTFKGTGCGTFTCAPTAVGDAGLRGTHAAGAPVVRDHVAVVAYGTHLIAFAV